MRVPSFPVTGCAWLHETMPDAAPLPIEGSPKRSPHFCYHMKKARTVLVESEERAHAEVQQGPPRPGSHTLLGGVASVFPKAVSDSLEEWLSEVPKKAGPEQERLLFLILLC